jgi:hypothetical protein
MNHFAIAHRAKSLLYVTICGLAVGGFSSTVQAGFFIPKGTTMTMVTLSPDEQNYEIAYGFDRRVSGALGVTRVREGSDDAAWRSVALGQFAYLVSRQSTEKGIFNAYVWAGPIAQRLGGDTPESIGASTHKHVVSKPDENIVDPHKTRAGAHAGVWIDYETRSLYTRVKAHAFRTEGWRRNEVVAQAMLAPYEADYEDIASWGGVQLKRVSGAKTEVTPFVRFFQRRWWIDAGVSVDRTHRNNFFLNLIYTF